MNPNTDNGPQGGCFFLILGIALGAGGVLLLTLLTARFFH